MAQSVKVGDVVYADGASAILGDVTAVDPDGFATITWRETTTVEDIEELTVVAEAQAAKSAGKAIIVAICEGGKYQQAYEYVPIEGRSFRTEIRQLLEEDSSLWIGDLEEPLRALGWEIDQTELDAPEEIHFD